MHFSCPYIIQQSIKSKCILWTLKNVVRTLLFQAHLPKTYWVEDLIWPPIWSIYCPPLLYIMIHPFTNYLTNNHPTPIDGYLVVFVIHAFILITNFNLVPPHAYSLVTLKIIKGTEDLTFTQNKSLSLDMSYLASPSSFRFHEPKSCT